MMMMMMMIEEDGEVDFNTTNPNSNNQSNQNELTNILTVLARQSEILNNQTRELAEIRGDTKEIRLTLKDYMPLREANVKFDALQSMISALQTQMAEIQAWRMASSVATVREISAVQLNSKQDVGQAKEASWGRLISAQGAILVAVGGFLLWIIEQFLLNGHVLGR